MEHAETEGPVAVIARRVKELRGRKGFTAQELADKLRAAGVPWDRATVTKLETRRRQSVSVVEFMALARVLDVAPVHLLVPLGVEEPYQVTPEEVVPASRARLWVRGESALRGTDPQIFYTERPIGEVPQVAQLEPAVEILEPKSKGEED
ncbi:transcriptional regulator with XRE-family HTH domain [Streptomyces sp. PvR006]|uniref:helix-turn-helix domain-containing protein n=1 Tax=Streptomyces sp. PvR006 TaxID=2817860 RepID=UPI001AE5606F|nr:helix-turn-helix transcriptional regulator [Streptomyces sp. PvR006]MBP2581630.1 transcriptional regulator with XRE-family HTH domain [Streptomyces sp. PvR006]